MKTMKGHQNKVMPINSASKIILFFIVLFSGEGVFGLEYQDYEKKIKNFYNIRNVIEKMPRRNIEESLRNFTVSGRPSRFPGSPGHEKARLYLENILKSKNSIGSSYSKIKFTGNGENLVWEKKGTTRPDEVLIITAHYDTILKDPKTGNVISKGEMPGADNNASGVSIMLSMIEILDKLELPKTVKFIFFDQEEHDNAGSIAYASTAEFKAEKEAKKINGVINLTMLAHDSRIGDADKKMNNMKIYSGDTELVSSLVSAGKKNYETVSFAAAPVSGDSRFVDSNKAFRELGIPSVTFSQNRETDLNPRFQTSNDFVETLNINTYTNVFKYVTSAVLAWNYDVVK